MKKLSHPEFIAPASLIILIGLALSATNVLLGLHDLGSWGIIIYLIATGFAVAFRIPVGTGMLAVGLIVLLGYRTSEILSHRADWSLNVYNGTKAALGLIWYGAMVAAVVEQIAYFRNRASPENPKAEQTPEAKGQEK